MPGVLPIRLPLGRIPHDVHPHPIQLSLISDDVFEIMVVMNMPVSRRDTAPREPRSGFLAALGDECAEGAIESRPYHGYPKLSGEHVHTVTT
jgi:hypothetical protein